jgi:disulfide oxidoreductase YuzD
MKPNSCACYGSNQIHECYCNLNQNNMKQVTAVEWLQEAISKKVNNELGPYFIDLFDNAKAMEKQQIIDAYLQKRNKGEISEALKLWDEAEQYYTSTFGS